MNAECGHRNFDPTPHNEVDIAEFLDGDTNFVRFCGLSGLGAINRAYPSLRPRVAHAQRRAYARVK